MPSGCALLGGFAVGARVSLLRQHSAEREISASACTRCMPGIIFVPVLLCHSVSVCFFQLETVSPALFI